MQDKQVRLLFLEKICVHCQNTNDVALHECYMQEMCYIMMLSQKACGQDDTLEKV